MARRRGRADRVNLSPRILASAAGAAYALCFILLSTGAAVSQFSYLGFGLNSPSAAQVFLTLAVAALVGFVSPIGTVSPGKLAIWLLALLTVLPTLAVAPTLNRPGVLTLSAIVLLGYSILVLIYHLNVLPVQPPQKLQGKAFAYWVLALAVPMTAMTVLSYGLNLQLTSFADMYDVREAFEQTVATQGNPLAPYAMSMATKVLSPALIGMGIVWRRPSLLLTGAAIQVLMYLVVPQKLNLALALAVAALAYAMRGRTLTLPAVTAMVGSVAALLTFLFREPGDLWFSSSVFRTFYVPIDVGLMWVDFLGQGDKGNFADALPFVSNSYAMDLPKLISTAYGSGAGAFNAHLWADGFGNAGFTGVVIVSIALGLLLRLCDDWSSGSDARVSSLLILGPTISLANGSLPTTLASGGMLLALLLISVTPAREAVTPARASPDARDNEPTSAHHES